jgi:hypothetical protein
LPTAASVVEGCTQVATDEDPLLDAIVRDREVAFNVEGNVSHLEGEKTPSFNVGALIVQPPQVEDVHAIDLVTKQRVDQHTPILDLVGSSSPPSDISPPQNPPPDMSFPSEEVLNPNVDHDLPIVKQYLEYKNAREQRVYTDEEEREAAIKFLKSRVAPGEDPFTVVVSKVKQKNMQKGFQVPNTRSRGRHPD